MSLRTIPLDTPNTMERRLLQFVSEPVAQQGLDTLVTLENQIRALQQTRNEEVNKIIDRLNRGHAVEPGTHTAELRGQSHGSAYVLRLVLNGLIIG